MKVFGWFTGLLIVAAIIAALNSFFIVDQRQQALVLQVGRAVDVFNEAGSDEAGLHFKIPLVQSVVTLDKRNLGLDIPDILVIASDQEQLLVDAFVRWRITDPLEFYRRFNNQRNAADQLKGFTESAIREALGSKLPAEIISGQRSALMNTIRTNLNARFADRGIDIIDVRIRRADLPGEVSERVFRRMQTARHQEAERIRAEGVEAAQLIRATAERERTVLLADARRDSESIRGDGDAERNEIYAAAYSKDISFFRFQRALIACENSITDGTRVIVAPDNLDLCQVFIDEARRAGAP